MPKKRFTEDDWQRHPYFRSLCAALLACKTIDEVALLLRDVGTLSELRAWSERLEVAKQLMQGKTYRQIAKNIGASTTTVTRVAKFLESGEGGYRHVLRAGSAPQSGVQAEGIPARQSINVAARPDESMKKFLQRKPNDRSSVST